MLFILDKDKRSASKTEKLKLSDIKWKEEDLQSLLFANLSTIFPDDSLLLISQSRKWQEEPDIMALDKDGCLNIFELKRSESQSSNLLQALRYGQIFGQYNYDSINLLFKKFNPSSPDVLTTLNEKFSTSLSSEQINKRQKFVVITNGIDYNTRQAINYWREIGVDIQCWVFRIHKIEGQFLLEFDKFKISDNPFEDLQEGYYLLNTNVQNGIEDENEMLREKKAAAYFGIWKEKIKSLKRGDKVFLYSSKTGIVAKGIATGNVQQKNYQNKPEYLNEEYYQNLTNFKILPNPISASEMKRITEDNFNFRMTLVSISKSAGEKLWNV